MYCIRDWEVLARTRISFMTGADVTDLQFTGSPPHYHEKQCFST